MARFFALVLIGTVAVTGALPSVTGYRCIPMDQRMLVGERDCCPKCDAPPLSIGEPCCESVAAVRLDVRESTPKSAKVGPAPYAGLLTFALVPDSLSSQVRPFEPLSRGRPPGERLQLFSSVLRV